MEAFLMTRLAGLSFLNVVLSARAVSGRHTMPITVQHEAISASKAGSGRRTSLACPVACLAVISIFFIVSSFRALSKTHATVENKVVDGTRSAVVRVRPVTILAVCMAGKAVLVFSIEVRRAVLHTLPLVQEELVHALFAYLIVNALLTRFRAVFADSFRGKMLL